MKQILNILILAISIACVTSLSAQNLVVTLTNSTTESFPVVDIQSIKFGSETMILNELDGTVNTWSIDNIDNYAFDGVATLSDELNIVSSNLIVYPNPAINLVSLAFTNSQATTVTIDILDASGRIIEKIYQGEHQGQQTYKWNSNVQTGTYYCRINSGSKIITKPIIIQ
ncbi:MAG: T9SS type A sorting domain-containing protein [Crocinitomicaceae bacterium]|nr:T9SS type A sorting domain-containing protein [Crocinitomicaceae bacterium]